MKHSWLHAVAPLLAGSLLWLAPALAGNLGSSQSLVDPVRREGQQFGRQDPNANPQPAAQAQQTADLNAAIAEALKEYHTHLADHAPPRDKSDFFADARGKYPFAVVLAALEKSQANDTAADCYVRWQLLSALPPTVPPEFASRAVQIYIKCPKLTPNPGLNHRPLDADLRKAGTTHQNQLESLNADFKKTIDAWQQSIEFPLKYRDALYAHLPRTTAVLQAAFADLAERAQNGIRGGAFWDRLNHDTRAWAAGIAEDPPPMNDDSGIAQAAPPKPVPSDVTPAAENALAQGLNRLVGVLNNPANQPYVRIDWDGTQLHWFAEAPVPPDAVADLGKTLKGK